MPRCVAIFILLILPLVNIAGQSRRMVVADSASCAPLPGATVFDRNGTALGMSDSRGRLPAIARYSYPLTIRYLGFSEKAVAAQETPDTIFLAETASELPEVVVESPRHRVLHILAYVREYSTLTTYTDTVFLFREKMTDYMLAPDSKIKFRGWSSPRILASRSYYRFTNTDGLDSVSDAGNHHFSWSDWVGAPPTAKLPAALVAADCATDTVGGLYCPAEIWSKNNSRVIADIDVLADTTSRKWVPNLSGFFHSGLDFEQFRVRFNYDDVAGDSVAAADLTGYSFNIESRGRAREMFRFNHVDQPIFVNTYAEVYVLDKEYITVKEARKWERHKFDPDEVEIYEAPEAPPLQQSVYDLVARVEEVDKARVRLHAAPDRRLMGRHNGNRNFRLGQRALLMLKQATGISAYKSRRNFNRRWNGLKKPPSAPVTQPDVQ